uniref:Protein Jade-1 n=1 Tax=Xiphophorus couchianus TaxID=32473 RepID=A0A3B5L4F0_9TELE
MKRSRHPSSSDDSDNGRNQGWIKLFFKMQGGNSPSLWQVFRTDFITAMKLHDSYQLNPEDYYVLADPWRQEWEKGVQVPVSPQSIPQPVTRVLAEKGKEVMFIRPKKLIRTSGTEALGYVDIRTLAEGMCRYDLNEEDVAWLQITNEEFAQMAMPPLDENTMERVMEEFEHCCHENMTHAMETEEGLGIEYDEDVVCDVCQSPDGEDNNEMVFCDKCNICVHQACYGIQKVPKGSWLCRICALGILPKCQVCPKKGGAMKPTRSGTKWVHVSCALWIPEVSIGNPEKMEPITNVSHIPSNRWALICCLCKEKTGACIQCSAKNCRTAFHVTCGLHANLEMNTILTEDDEVKFKSYCPKHSGFQGDPAEDEGREGARDRKGRANSDQEKRVNLRKLKLQEMEEEFYQFVDVEEVANSLKVAPEVVDFVYQYWKLKRKANFNQQLLTPKKDEEESLARREQEVLLRRLQLFTHLRQDLERVRNLTYMVTRREKMKRSLCKVQEQIFQQQVRLLDHELLNGESSPTQSTRVCTEDCWSAGHVWNSVCVLPTDWAWFCIPGEPSAKDLERLFSLGSFSSDGRQSGSSWSNSGLKSKRSSLKQERRKSLLDSPSVHKKDNANSDSDEYLFDDATTRRSGASPDAAPNTKFKPSSVSDASKANSWLRKPANGSSHAPNGSASGHLKGWGKFRIPKRADKPPSATLREREELEPSNPLLRPLTNAPESAYPRTRLRSGPEADGYSSDSKAADSELEPCLKRCHSHELRGDSSLGRRYGSDIIRRGVLAS